MSRRRSLVIACTTILLVALTCIAFRLSHLPRASKRAVTFENARTSDHDLKPTLEIKSIVQHGHIVEIIGETDPGTTVMINGERAAVIFDHSGFRQFVGPLPDGISNITVTVQKDDGSVNTKVLSVSMP